MNGTVPVRGGRGVLSARAFWSVAAAVPALFLAAFFVWPVASLLLSGLSGEPIPGSSSTDPWATLVSPRTREVVAHTIIQASAATVGSVLLGIPGAFVLYRLEFRGRTLVKALVTVPFVLPTVVVAVAFTATFGTGGVFAGLGWERSLQIIVLALMFFNVTVVIRTVGGFWAQLDPRSAESARTLGASPARAWCTITLPALLPAIAAAGALVFLFCSTSFGVVLVLGGREFSTIETEIYRLAMQYLDLSGAAMLAALQCVFVGAVVWVSHVLNRRSEHRVQMRFAAQRMRPRREHAPVISVFAATLLLLHVVPMCSLLWQSLRNEHGEFTLAHYVNLFAPPAEARVSATVGEAFVTSLGVAIWATLIAVCLGVAITLVVTRTPRSRAARAGIRVLDSALMLPLGVSAVVLGLGLLLTMYRPLGLPVDLRSSPVLLPVAQALVALPIVVRMLTPSIRGIDPRLREAAATLGAPPLRVVGTIDLSMLGRASGLALGCALATSLGEFGASSFLVRPGATTLPVLIAELVGKPGAVHYGMALSGAVVLGVVTALIMLCAERFSTERVSAW